MVLFLFSNACLAEPNMRLEIYNDKSAALTFDDVEEMAFSTTDIKSLNSNMMASTYWVRVKVDDMSNSDLILRSCYMQIDKLTVMIHESTGWRKVTTGDLFPYSSRDIKHHCFAFDLSNSTRDEIYLRAQGRGLVSLPLEINTKTKFWQITQSEQLWYGFLFAFLFAMFIYNLLLFVMVLEKGYLYYISYLASMTLFLMAISGHSVMYLWPNAPSWGNISSFYLCMLAIFFAIHFLRDMTNIDNLAPSYARAMILFSYTGIVALVMHHFDVLLSIYALGFYLTASLLLITTAIIVSILKRWPPSYYLIFGPLVMVPGALIYYANFIGLVGGGWFVDNIVQITATIESVLLSLVLAYRIKMMTTKIQVHQQRANNAQRQLSQSLLKAADNERRTIARELHDNFGQGLLVIKNLIGRFEPSENLSIIKTQVSSLITDTRNMARSMHPQQIENLGFVTAIETMLDNTVETGGISLKLNFDDIDKLLNKDSELHLFRMLQEIASNIVKHSEATQVACNIKYEDNYLYLDISDNGIGMHENPDHGLGILNMLERAAIINAKIDFRNLKPSGTEVIIEVPV